MAEIGSPQPRSGGPPHAPFQTFPLPVTFPKLPALGGSRASLFSRLYLSLSEKCVRGQILETRMSRTPVGTIGAVSFPRHIR
jgi:hypothetical protein